MELFRQLKDFRTDWKKLILVVSVIALTLTITQTRNFPYPTTVLVFFSPQTSSPYATPNSTVQNDELSKNSDGQYSNVFNSTSTNLTVASNKTVITSISVITNSSQVTNPLNSTTANITLPNAEERHIISPTPGPVHVKVGERDLNKEVRDMSIFSPPPIKVTPVSSKITKASEEKANLWSLPRDRELVYAKKEIENAPFISHDPDLYDPLFLNVSVFRRSYELMEKLLKVYIYKEGDIPIFHTPILQGIYSSEGWFMKLMEGNKHFVVKNGDEAHLFYLPYSARRLEHALYIPNSHNMRPLLLFLKEYMNMIARKYPFWNRTHGSDHFFVACHDWGPYTTKEHEELKKNTIKALCNADISEGIFIAGKDVSLPEINLRNPKNPLSDIQGKPISRRPILAFFAGKMHGRVRPILLKYWEGKDDDMKITGPLPRRKRRSKAMTYAQYMKSSKFCICPMGYEVNSPRIVESIYYECVPVIIADNFVLPLAEVFNWTAFSITVAERDIPKLKEILLSIPRKQYITMQNNVKKVQKHFLWHTPPIKYDMFHMILHSVWFNRLNQIQVPPQ